MTPRWSDLIVGWGILVFGLYGCTTGRVETRGLPPKLLENCDVTVTHTAPHKIAPKSLSVKNKKDKTGCGADVIDPPVYIGTLGKLFKITTPPDDELQAEGSCRYCWFDTNGGLNCASYPGPPC